VLVYFDSIFGVFWFLLCLVGLVRCCLLVVVVLGSGRRVLEAVASNGCVFVRR
jgi:hypothetical protein